MGQREKFKITARMIVALNYLVAVHIIFKISYCTRFHSLSPKYHPCMPNYGFAGSFRFADMQSGKHLIF